MSTRTPLETSCQYRLYCPQININVIHIHFATILITNTCTLYLSPKNIYKYHPPTLHPVLFYLWWPAYMLAILRPHRPILIRFGSHPANNLHSDNVNSRREAIQSRIWHRSNAGECVVVMPRSFAIVCRDTDLAQSPAGCKHKKRFCNHHHNVADCGFTRSMRIYNPNPSQIHKLYSLGLARYSPAIARNHILALIARIQMDGVK